MTPYDLEVQYPSQTSLVPPLDGGWSVTVDRWHRAWSEPVRQKIAPAAAVALIASGLFAPVLDPDTQITQSFESRWHQPWSEPVVKTKPGLAASRQQALAWPTPVIIPSFGWYRASIEPQMPRLRGLAPSLQQALAWTPITITPFISLGWLEALSEPYLVRQRLAVSAHPAFAKPELTPPTPDILGLLAAFEKGDSFTGFGLKTESLVARVSIVELGRTGGISGIIEP